MMQSFSKLNKMPKKITTGADFGTIVCQCNALPLRNLHEARLGPLVQSKAGEGSGKGCWCVHAAASLPQGIIFSVCLWLRLRSLQ